MPHPTHHFVRSAIGAMGTRFEIVLADDRHDDANLHAAADEALQEVARLHALWTPFEPSSTIARVNRSAADGPIRLDANTFNLLIDCRRLWLATEGTFDPTIGALMKWWGFHASSDEPSPRERGEPRPPFGFAAVMIDESTRTIGFATRGLTLDLGAIGKGAALDAAALVLREAGIASALLHGGTSSILALGTPPESDGWPIRLGPEPAAPTIHLRNRALSVSRWDGRTLQGNGREIGHTFDPRTGDPSRWHASPRRDPAAATVLHARALDADAWSTALLVDPSLVPAAISSGCIIPCTPGPCPVESHQCPM